MAGIPRPTLNRIPGGGMPVAQKDVQIKDITKLTHIELLEIKDREVKLLSNKAKLQKLPDKGKRIQDFYDKVMKELERRSNVDEAAKLFSELNIAATGQKTLNELEWRGRLPTEGTNNDPLEDVLDSDDEIEMDPLRIIAQKQMHDRKVKVEKEEVKLITAEDLMEIESFKVDSPDSGVNTKVGAGDINNTAAIDAEIVAIDIKDKLNSLKPKIQALSSSLNGSTTSSSCSSHLELDPHVHYLVEKTELQVKPNQKEKFLPYRTTVSNVHDPVKERARKQNIHWENTAATPPAIQHNGTQMLTLMDSVEIQTEYLTKLKDLQETQAAERLAVRVKRLEERQLKLPSAEVLKSNPSFNTYRSATSKTKAPYYTHHIEGSQVFNEDDEVHDPLDEEKSGGVNYTVFE